MACITVPDNTEKIKIPLLANITKKSTTIALIIQGVEIDFKLC